MTEGHDLPVPRRYDARLLLEDLACVSGTLSEIMTAWRRARPWRPELPLSSLTALQDATRQLAADITAAGRAGQRPDPARSVAARFSALSQAIAGTQAMTCGPGTSEAGDRGLWALVNAAMRRAETQLAELTSDLARSA